MTKKAQPSSAPLTFDLPVSMLKTIEALRVKLKYSSTSAVVRHAVKDIKPNRFIPTIDQHQQISVRVSPAERKALKAIAKQKQASIGEVVREAIKQLAAKK